jgi:hypothetical protein
VRPLTLDEIVDPARYEPLRGAYRDRVIAHKRARRAAVGDRVSLVFEDRETLRFQVQEMLRVEGITDPARMQHELDVYNELMPGERELSATLFVEIQDPSRIRAELDRLLGIDEHVALVLGEAPDETVVRARFDPHQLQEDRISAVQYIRFPLRPGEAEQLADPALRARLRIDHPSYRVEDELPAAVRESLVADLRGEPEPLLRPAPGPASRSDEVLIEEARWRVLRPAQPERPGHLVIEARDPGCSFLGADPAATADLLALLRRLAREITERHGRCRVSVELGAPGERWHLVPGSEP